MNITQMNYSNMLKRLERKSKESDFVLIYYSIFLIIISLACKYFPNRFDTNLAEYFNIILSVIILAYSLVNNNADYKIRIVNIEKSLNEIKDIKRRLNDDKLEEYRELYNKIVDKTEKRKDIDFLSTIRQLDKKYKKIGNCKDFNEQDRLEIERGKKKINDYSSEICKAYLYASMIIEFCWYICLIGTPIAVIIISRQ